MRIPIKYGLLITLGIVVWVILAHTLVPNTRSAVHFPGTPIFFNIMQFVMIYLGLRALERQKGDRLVFKEGLKNGVQISLVYVITVSLFFACVFAVVGTKWLAMEPSAGEAPASQVAAGAFAGLIISGMVLGLIYSTLISFFLAKRRSDE